MQFRRDIQGLRAVAIILVVLFHAWPRLLPGGFTGVDIFFVISGFLISSILLDGIETGSFSYARFYRHRIRRLFPALFLMLVAVTVAAFFVLSPAALNDFAATVATTVLFFSNIEFARSSDYFSTAAELKPLLHTWSLAVEEQFYLIFPLLLVVTKRWFRGRYLAVILSGGTISFLVGLWLGFRAPAVNFFLGPSRAFELMIGAALAAKLLPEPAHRLRREALAALGLVMILAPAFLLDPERHFSGLTALPSCIGAALLIQAGSGGDSAVARFLSRPLPNFIGTISYSLYLWHWPLLSLLRSLVMRQPTAIEIAATIALSFLLATLSWRLVEGPILARPADRRFLASMAVAAASLLAVSGAPYWPARARQAGSRRRRGTFLRTATISALYADDAMTPPAIRCPIPTAAFSERDPRSSQSGVTAPVRNSHSYLQASYRKNGYCRPHLRPARRQ